VAVEDARGPFTLRSGNESFHERGAARDFALLDFWRWSASALVGNALRGRLAEFLVARALGASLTTAREEWTAYDVQAPGGARIEVKSAAYLQSWPQGRPSQIRFDIAPKRAWDPLTNELAAHATRSSDAYVFALLATRERAALDPLDLTQWRFWALATRDLHRRLGAQKTIGLTALEKATGAGVAFDEIARAVAAALKA
jgi:hypothetical protein